VTAPRAGASRSGSTPSACWPGSNPKDLPFFKRVPDAVFRTAKISPFGATERPGVPPWDDANIQALVEAGPPVVTIFGNAWDFHVTSALGGGVNLDDQAVDLEAEHL
jgi:isopropylmalate/homocitrate/citramalate synthase